MIAKYDIDYLTHPQHNHRVATHRTDDPVEAEDFLITLLAGGARITAIKHEGVALEPVQSDQMVRVSAERLASRLLCHSLGLDSAAVKQRFNFAV